MNVDFNIRVTDIIELVLFAGGLVSFWIRFTKLPTAASIDAFKAEITTRFNALQSEVMTRFNALQTVVTTSISNFQLNLDTLQKRFDDADTKYVRVDVHKANLELVNVKLSGLARIEEELKKVLNTPPRRYKRRAKR